jgi:hypothetical protein
VAVLTDTPWPPAIRAWLPGNSFAFHASPESACPSVLQLNFDKRLAKSMV